MHRVPAVRAHLPLGGHLHQGGRQARVAHHRQEAGLRRRLRARPERLHLLRALRPGLPHRRHRDDPRTRAPGVRPRGPGAHHGQAVRQREDEAPGLGGCDEAQRDADPSQASGRGEACRERDSSGALGSGGRAEHGCWSGSGRTFSRPRTVGAGSVRQSVGTGRSRCHVRSTCVRGLGRSGSCRSPLIRAERRSTGCTERRSTGCTERRSTGCTERRSTGCTERRSTGCTERRSTGCTDRRSTGCTERRSTGCTDRRSTDGCTELRSTDGCTERRSTDGCTERRSTDGCTERRSTGCTERRSTGCTELRFTGCTERRSTG